MTTRREARTVSTPSSSTTLGHSLLAGGWSCALALMPFALWSLFCAPGPFEEWKWRIALASGLAATYVLAGCVIGLLVGAFFVLLGLGRSRSPGVAGALSGALALAVWTRPIVGDVGSYVVGVVGIPLFALLGTRLLARARAAALSLLFVFGGGVVLLVFLGQPAEVRSADLIRAALSPGSPGASRAWPSGTPRPRNVVMLVVDTLRADHLSAYGYERRTSPHLETLAAEGLRFDAAIVQRPKTSPSVASILTGLYPHTHGISGTKSELSLEFDTLAELYRRAGYETAGFVANANLFRRFRFDQGFQVYEEYGTGSGSRARDDAQVVNEGVLSWLAEREDAGRGEKPFFLYVHYMDPHTPYAPPPGFDEDRYVGDELYGRYAHLDVPIGKGYVGTLDQHLVLDGGSRDIDLYIARYDAEIAFCDREIGRLVDAMRERGILDETLLLVSSDHGESMTEHGVYFNHGLFPYENNVRVPLIVRHPAFESGRVVEEVVQSIDFAPTLLDASGIEAPEAMEGETLLPLALGSGAKELEVAFAEAGESHDEELVTTLRTREDKLILFRRRAPSWYEIGAGPLGVLRHAAFDPGRWHEFMRAFQLEEGREHERELYDLRHDPDETTNLVDENPARVKELNEGLEPFRDAAYRVRPDTRIDTSELDADTLETLKSLGYVQ